MADPTYSRSIGYDIGLWICTGLAIVAVVSRLYSRIFLTRSVGSDDYTIVVALLLTTSGSISDSIAVANGFGRHAQFLSNKQVEKITKLEHIGWLRIFIDYFFLRTSVMLFTLRLLPCTKIWPRRVIYVAFLLNFAITLIAVVCYGVKCTPFPAVYTTVPNARCRPNTLFTASQMVNGVLACIIDIATALIPESLLWGLQMRRRTKIVLNAIFGLGLITAGLSIGRAATTNNSSWDADMTWNSIPASWFSFVEIKLGIFFASCPALRQMFAYWSRSKTLLPTSRCTPPDADFVAMRKRVKLRDLFWYSEHTSGDSQAKTNTEIRQVSPESVEVRKSPLDVWRSKLKASFTPRAPFHLVGREKNVNQRPEDKERLTKDAAQRGRHSATAESERINAEKQDPQTFLLTGSDGFTAPWPASSSTSTAVGEPARDL